MSIQQQRKSVSRSAALTIPELEQSKAAVLNALASSHSRRMYEYAIEKFIAWYCDEPRLAFNRSVVVRYTSTIDWTISLIAATPGIIFPPRRGSTGELSLVIMV